MTHDEIKTAIARCDPHAERALFELYVRLLELEARCSLLVSMLQAQPQVHAGAPPFAV
jgi:hypothetical protein